MEALRNKHGFICDMGGVIYIMRHSLQMLGCQREETVIIGDRMDTDIVAGIDSGIDTALVLSGITRESDLQLYAYKPHYILRDVREIAKD